MHRKIAGLIVTLFCLLCASSPCSFAQKNEVSFSAGAVATSDQHVTSSIPLFCTLLNPNCNNFTNSTSAGVAFEGAYTRQLFTFGEASLDVEFPVVGAPGRDLKSTAFGSTPVASSISSFFFTPSARFKFFHSSRVSPFVSVGGGFAHFRTHTSFPTFGLSSSTGSTGSALQFGGGLDFKTPLPHLDVRVQVRDFLAPVSSPQNNVFAGGGIVVKF